MREDLHLRSLRQAISGEFFNNFKREMEDSHRYNIRHNRHPKDEDDPTDSEGRTAEGMPSSHHSEENLASDK